MCCIAQYDYPVLRSAQSALRFTSMTDLFNQTPSEESLGSIQQLMHEYKHPPLSIARYSFIQLSELENVE